MSSSTSSSHRILIVRLSAIGDVIHGLPVLNALREHFPKAFLAWVCEPLGTTLLTGHESLNDLIEVPKGFLKNPKCAWNLRKTLRSMQFDTAIDLQGLTKSAIVSWLSGAPRRIGYKGADGRELSTWFNNELVEPEKAHVIDRGLELLTSFGITQPAVTFQIPENEQASSKAESYKCDTGMEDGFAVINPGAGWPSKRWPLERFSQVANHLKENHNLPSVVVWAGEDERKMAEGIIVGAKEAAVLGPATTLPELAALLRLARICIGSDTGPIHLAAAVDTPTVALYGPMPAERNGPYGAKHIALQKVTLTGTSRERRSAGPESMEAIPVAEVSAACDDMLTGS